LAVAALLLNYGADPNIKDDVGCTPLHYAAEYGHDKIAQLLLEYWADLNAMDKDRFTPLHSAAKNDRAIVATLLLESGAVSDVIDKSESVPLHYANGRTTLAILGMHMDHPRQVNVRGRLFVF
jgi:ankyrin repeat protein